MVVVSCTSGCVLVVFWLCGVLLVVSLVMSEGQVCTETCAKCVLSFLVAQWRNGRATEKEIKVREWQCQICLWLMQCFVHP